MSRKRPAAPPKPPASGGRIRRGWRALFKGYWKGKSKGQRIGGSIASFVLVAAAVVGALATVGVFSGGGSRSGDNAGASPGAGQASTASYAPVTTTGGVTLYRIDIGNGPRASLRTAPNTASRRLTRLTDGAKVRILCTKQGEVIETNLGSSRIWDYVQPVGSPVRGYVSDALIYTGVSGAVAHPCR